MKHLKEMSDLVKTTIKTASLRVVLQLVHVSQIMCIIITMLNRKQKRSKLLTNDEYTHAHTSRKVLRRSTLGRGSTGASVLQEMDQRLVLLHVFCQNLQAQTQRALAANENTRRPGKYLLIILYKISLTAA
jgi:hypothetical protein